MATFLEGRLGWRNTFVGRVFTLTTGAVLGQAVTVIMMPVVSRLFTVADFAVWGYVAAYCALLAPAACLGFDIQIPRSRNGSDARSLAVTSLVSLLCISTALAILLPNIAEIAFPKVASLLHWSTVPVAFGGLLSIGATSVGRFYLIRTSKYHILSLTTLVQNVVRTVLHLSWGLIRPSWYGLACGEIFGRGAGGMLGLSGVIKELSSADLRLPKREYQWPALLAGCSALLDSATAQVPLVLLGRTFDLAAVGSFSFVQRALVLPVTLIGLSVADVVHGTFLERANEAGSFEQRFVRIVGLLLLLGMPGALVLVVFGPPLFSMMFGPRWAEAGQMARYMAPWFLLEFAVSPLSRLVHITDRQDIKLSYNVVALLGPLLAWTMTLYLAWGPTGYIASLSLLRSAAYIYFLLRLYRLVQSIDSASPGN